MTNKNQVSSPTSRNPESKYKRVKKNQVSALILGLLAGIIPTQQWGATVAAVPEMQPRLDLQVCAEYQKMQAGLIYRSLIDRSIVTRHQILEIKEFNEWMAELDRGYAKLKLAIQQARTTIAKVPPHRMLEGLENVLDLVDTQFDKIYEDGKNACTTVYDISSHQRNLLLACKLGHISAPDVDPLYQVLAGLIARNAKDTIPMSNIFQLYADITNQINNITKAIPELVAESSSGTAGIEEDDDSDESSSAIYGSLIEMLNQAKATDQLVRRLVTVLELPLPEIYSALGEQYKPSTTWVGGQVVHIVKLQKRLEEFYTKYIKGQASQRGLTLDSDGDGERESEKRELDLKDVLRKSSGLAVRYVEMLKHPDTVSELHQLYSQPERIQTLIATLNTTYGVISWEELGLIQDILAASSHAPATAEITTSIPVDDVIKSKCRGYGAIITEVIPTSAPFSGIPTTRLTELIGKVIGKTAKPSQSREFRSYYDQILTHIPSLSDRHSPEEWLRIRMNRAMAKDILSFIEIIDQNHRYPPGESGAVLESIYSRDNLQDIVGHTGLQPPPVDLLQGAPPPDGEAEPLPQATVTEIIRQMKSGKLNKQGERYPIKIAGVSTSHRAQIHAAVEAEKRKDSKATWLKVGYTIPTVDGEPLKIFPSTMRAPGQQPNRQGQRQAPPRAGRNQAGQGAQANLQRRPTQPPVASPPPVVQSPQWPVQQAVRTVQPQVAEPSAEV
ncbi:MAG: hypothetical protein LBL32_02050, partial [Holosporales bacterium]|nr:hypothetical protein [Holosporales bacterium]